MNIQEIKNRLKIYYIIYCINCIGVGVNIYKNHLDLAGLNLILVGFMVMSIFVLDGFKKDLEEKGLDNSDDLL